MTPMPTTDLLDNASLSILRAQQYARMIREMHEDMANELADRFFALNQALEEALDEAKDDVDLANSQLVVDRPLAFQEALSTPDASVRHKPETATALEQLQGESGITANTETKYSPDDVEVMLVRAQRFVLIVEDIVFNRAHPANAHETTELMEDLGALAHGIGRELKDAREMLDCYVRQTHMLLTQASIPSPGHHTKSSSTAAEKALA
jgi:hypothetical protein